MRAHLILGFLLATTSFTACSSDPATSGATSGAGGTSGDTTSTTSTGTGTGGQPMEGKVTEVTPSEKLAPVYIEARSNGNLVLTEGSAKRMIEVKPDGTVIAINATDWGTIDWPTWLTTDAAGKIYVTAFRKVWLYDDGVKSPKKTWLPQEGNQGIDALTWGGPNNATFYAVRNMLSYTAVFAYAAPTADAAGPGTEVAKIEMAGVASSMVAMPDGTVYAFSSNACRLVRVKPDGTVQNLYGHPTENKCPFAGTDPLPNELAQGAGMVLRNGKIVFAETSSKSLREIDVSVDPPKLGVLARGYAFKDVTVASDGTIWAVEADTYKILKVTF